MDDASVVTESAVVARRVATEFTEHSNLLPHGDRSTIDEFVDLWTGTVEKKYYDVLSADSESQAKFAVAGFCEALVAVEDALWRSAATRAS